MNMKCLCLSAICSVLCLASSQAATIVYGFEGPAQVSVTNLNAPVTSNDFGSGITASDWNVAVGDSGRPAHVQPLGSQSGSSAHTSAYLIVEKGGATDTHTFSVTIPDLGSAFVNFTNLSFDFGEVGPDGGAPTWTITSNLGGGTITPNTANGVGTGDWNTDSASLALAGNFASVNNTTVTFTLTDAAGGNNNSNTWGTWIDNVTLTGTVIPEPSAALLSAFGSLLLLRRRRSE